MSSAELEQVRPGGGLAASAWAWGGAALSLAVAGLVLVYAETAAAMAQTWWRSPTYAHGMLIPLISLYMAWSRRRHLAQVLPQADPRGLGLLVPLAAAWLVANVADVLVVQQLAFVAMIPALVITLLGGRVARALAFPLAYLFFAVPLGNGLIPPLQDFTAHFSVGGLRLSGIPVFAEGRFISIPSGNFEVAEACSGVRYLIASVALGCLFAYLNYRSPWRRLAFIAAAALIPILANGVRAYGIILLAHLSNMKLAVGMDHIIYGWVFFGVVMALLFWVGSYWREPAASPASAGGNGPAAEGAGRGGGETPWRMGATAIAALALAAAGPAAGTWLERPVGARPGLSLTLPTAPAWSGPAQAERPWPVVFPGADARTHRRYRRNGQAVQVLAIHYQHQRQGKELIAAQHRLYDGKTWRRVGETRRQVAVGEGSYRLRELRLTNGHHHRLVWSWYAIGDHQTIRPTVAKLWQAWERLRRSGAGSTLVAVAADYRLEPGPARQRLKRFLNDVPVLAAPGGVRTVTAEEEL